MVEAGGIEPPSATVFTQVSTRVFRQLNLIMSNAGEQAFNMTSHRIKISLRGAVAHPQSQPAVLVSTAQQASAARRRGLY